MLTRGKIFCGLVIALSLVTLYDGNFAVTTAGIQVNNALEVKNGRTIGVLASGNRLYLCTYQAFEIYDLSNPLYPVLLGSTIFDLPATAGFDCKMVAKYPYVYIAHADAGFRVMDVSNPTNPLLVGAIRGFRANGLDISGDYAYVACIQGSYSGVKVINISDPSEPSLVSSVMPFLHNYASISLRIQDSYAFLAAGSLGVKSIDISKPESPVFASTLLFPSDRAYGVDVSGKYAVLSNWVTYTGTSYRVVDISNPFDLKLVSTVFPNDHTTHRVRANGSFAYFTGNGVRILDFSDPSNPRLVAGVFRDNINRQFTANCLDFEGSYLYVGSRDSYGKEMLYVIDITGYSNMPPQAQASENLSILSSDQDKTILRGLASDPDNDPITYRWLEGTNEISAWQTVGPNGEADLDLSTVLLLTIGNHTLTLEVSDGQAIISDEMVLTVSNSAPNSSPSGGGTYQIYDVVSLGGEVSDFDGDLLVCEWLEGETILFTFNVEAVQGGDPVILPKYNLYNLPLGEHTITLRVADGVNGPVSKDIAVNVIDSTAPTLAPVPNLTILWPPNHKMVDIRIITNAKDNTGGPVNLSAEISTNEPIHSKEAEDFSPDWTEPVIDQVNGIISFQLRSERSGFGNGRIYTVVITATDESGNSTQAQQEIIVPADRRK